MTKRYLNWMRDTVCDSAHNGNEYNKLFRKLYSVDFYYSIDLDQNRAADGMTMRYNFILANNMDEQEEKQLFRDKPCSVLEMMVALAKRCENAIMQDSNWGDRTPVWFWSMINNLGLSGQDDDNFDEKYVDECLYTLLERTYSADGRGGLFYIPGRRDLRKAEIWYQAMWYLNMVIDEEGD